MLKCKDIDHPIDFSSSRQPTRKTIRNIAWPSKSNKNHGIIFKKISSLSDSQLREQHQTEKMSVARLLVLVCFVSTYIALSEGLSCWFCIREEPDFKKSLKDTCERMECSGEPWCYTEVLESELECGIR